jgi:penicillin-binding protein 2
MSAFASHRVQARAERFRWVLVLIFGVLGAAFFQVQVVQHERYRLRSESNRLRAIPLTAPRGVVLDRNGLVIADNVPGYAVKLLAAGPDSLRAVLRRLSALVPLDSAAMEQVVRRHRLAPYQPALVFNSQSFEVIARLEEHRVELPGLVIQTEPRRFYPAGRAMGHVIGYVGEVSEEELDRGRYPGARMGTIVGREGLEQTYDSVLRGREGVRYIEVDARGRVVREEASTPSIRPASGRPLRTTIDLPLQLYIDSLFADSLRAFHGAMVAMTPAGEVLALYSSPSFDPNEFVGGISAEKYQALTIREAGLPLFNRATKGAYPPASPFKLAIAAMALRRGLISFASHMEQPCRGGLRFGNRVFRCWKPEGHGSLDLIGAIAASCDVYFYQLGLRLGLSAILEDGTRMGFGDLTGIDLASETRSFFPTSRAYYDRTYGPRGWTNAVTLNLAIGQGENNQTLINVMRFYQALAGDGRARTPHLAVTAAPAAVDLRLSPSQLAGLREALTTVVTRGTAAGSRGREYNVAGKTGTAQNAHGPDHGWFIGFAPADDPQIIVGSILERALHGSSVAPWVVRVIRRYLVGSGGDPRGPIEIVVPDDTAPRVEVLRPDTIPPR